MTLLSGCSMTRYLIQATEGQLALINRAKPIPEVIQDPRTPPRVRDLLAEIGAIKQYGETRGLKPTTNYTEYVKLDRPAAVWVVSACEPLEFKSREWHFPLVGSFPYLGWFDLEQAKNYAKDMKEEGLDVDVRGAAAYSTLGWFRDAVLSTMIPEGDTAIGELANVVIHESVHATVYISGQAYFNESVANFVADRLTEPYLERHPREKVAYFQAIAEGETRRKRLHEAYEALKTLYASAKSNDQKLAEKKQLLEALKTELGFKRDINNATLIQFKAYHTGTSDFAALWNACGSDSRRFMKAVGTLRKDSFQKGQQEDLAPVLAKLTAAGC